MKTTLHLEPLHRHEARRAATRAAGSPTLRLGLIVSALAAVLAVLVEVVVDVPAVLILIPVVVIAFALSWHATGRPPQSPLP